MKNIQKSLKNLDVSKYGRKIKTIDMHTGGEPLRIVLDGYPPIKGRTVLEKRHYLKTHLDYLRLYLMWEPRGHADMYGCVLVEPNDSEADFGVIFMHNDGYSTMCGHAIIALASLAVELDWVKKEDLGTKVTIDAPCGRIRAFVLPDGSVEFEGVPSFVLQRNIEVMLDDTKRIQVDIAYGGAFYAYVDISQFNFGMDGKDYQQLINMGRIIKQKIKDSALEILHPYESDLSFLYGTIFYSKVDRHQLKSKNVCVFADGEVDRCPTGSGVCGRMALHYFKGEIDLESELQVSSITGSSFTGKIKSQAEFGSHRAIIPLVSGTAFVTGVHSFLIDPNDPIQEGFFLR
jgi:trans-L-3-hydroxyproline dehydratase